MNERITLTEHNGDDKTFLVTSLRTSKVGLSAVQKFAIASEGSDSDSDAIAIFRSRSTIEKSAVNPPWKEQKHNSIYRIKINDSTKCLDLLTTIDDIWLQRRLCNVTYRRATCAFILFPPFTVYDWFSIRLMNFGIIVHSVSRCCVYFSKNRSVVSLDFYCYAILTCIPAYMRCWEF